MASDTGESPVLNAAQLLWATVLTDLAVLALATDPPNRKVLNRKPDHRSSPIITCRMAKMILGQAICQLVITLVLYFGWFSFPSYHQDTSNVAEAKLRRNTFVFNTFIWLQIFNALNSRRLDNRLNVFKGIMRNRRFFFIGFVVVGGQLLIMFIGNKAFKVVPLDGMEWGVSICIGCLSLLCGVLLRLAPDFWFYRFFDATHRVSRRLGRVDEERRAELEDYNSEGKQLDDV
jgi:Ca2+-transporting ATPase